MNFCVKIFITTLLIANSYSVLSNTSENAKQFGSLPDVSDVLISPNGKYVGVKQKTEETIIVKIIDLEKAQLFSVHDFGRKGQITDFFWATDERLVFTVARDYGRTTELYNAGQLVAADIDGKRTKLIAGYGSASDTRQGKRNRAKTDPDRPAVIVHRLPNDKDNILVSFFDNAGYNELSQLNIKT